MRIETQVSFKEYLRLMLGLTYKKPFLVFLLCVGIILIIGSILYLIGFKVPFDSPPYYQLIFAFSIIFLLPFFVYLSAKKTFSSSGRFQERIVYEFLDDYIKITGESFNSELTWEKTYKITELRNWIFIYQNRLVANIIPKKSFGNNLSEFKELVKRKTYIKNNFSPAKKYLSISLTFLPVLVFALMGLIIFLSFAKREIYLIPDNLEGEVIVVFDQPDGEPEKYLDKKRLYEIPDDGILYTQFKWNSGMHNREFHFQSNMKNDIDEVQKQYVFEAGKPDSDVVSIMDKGSYFYSTADKKDYIFRATRFVISPRKYLDEYSVEAITDSIIKYIE
jgi:hypothetical protein